MEIALVYPHQLFENHPALKNARKVLLIEDPLLFGNDPEWPANMHQQKLVLYRAAMKAFADDLKGKDYDLTYIDCPTSAKTSSDQLLDHHLPKSTTEIHIAHPEDDTLLQRIEELARKRDIKLTTYDSPNSLTPQTFLDQHIGKKKKPFMATFYQAQRKRMKILLDDDENPVGGQWSFDEDNRKKLPKGHKPPNEPTEEPNSYVKEAIEYVSSKFPDNIGSTDQFRWPVTHKDAKKWLSLFIRYRLENFGTYEDAISTEHRTLYHSAITPMLNIGLLEPYDVISKVLNKADDIPLNSIEGFIRQMIGWREFMRAIYRHRGKEIRTSNFWEFDRPMPASFYDGTTGIPPVDRVIKQILKDGYCHHIERLMVLGNFMLLCRIHPNDVYRWFMEMFVDSCDWVMVPNVYGMSQFADGGTFTTKPYISGSNYICKMSDEKKGPWCKTWDGLFWSFIADHQDFFLKNHRLSMMARNWDKQSPDKQSAHRKAANEFLKNLK